MKWGWWHLWWELVTWTNAHKSIRNWLSIRKRVFFTLFYLHFFCFLAKYNDFHWNNESTKKIDFLLFSHVSDSPSKWSEPTTFRGCHHIGRRSSSSLCRISSKRSRLFSRLKFKNIPDMRISIAIGNQVRWKNEKKLERFNTTKRQTFIISIYFLCKKKYNVCVPENTLFRFEFNNIIIR